jgi:hypothetical protein
MQLFGHGRLDVGILPREPREQTDGMKKKDGVMFADGAFCIPLGLAVFVCDFIFETENPDVSDFEYTL